MKDDQIRITEMVVDTHGWSYPKELIREQRNRSNGRVGNYRIRTNCPVCIELPFSEFMIIR